MTVSRIALVCGCFMLFALSANAQQADESTSINDTPPASAPPATDNAADQAAALEENGEKAGKIRFNPDEYQSLVFTHWEHVAIQDVRNSRGQTRTVTDAELMRDLKKREDELQKVKPPPEEREIRLSGIVYNDQSDWTIWLNEQRVTPSAIPEEVMDLKVYKGYIEFRWFDDYTNKIFPIRLRPHQRFNIDTRIFLPG